jgi:ATP-binding cassette subfamily B protein
MLLISDVYRAAAAAQIHDTILRLPHGYHTLVGERGVKFSGGERQRILIAREILKDPKILLLDEPTSAMDTRTDENIQLELTKLREGRTTIMIAHRLSTIKDADWIVLLDHQKIKEQGTHSKLIAKNGEFCKMWESQNQVHTRRSV